MIKKVMNDFMVSGVIGDLRLTVMFIPYKYDPEVGEYEHDHHTGLLKLSIIHIRNDPNSNPFLTYSRPCIIDSYSNLILGVKDHASEMIKHINTDHYANKDIPELFERLLDSWPESRAQFNELLTMSDAIIVH